MFLSFVMKETSNPMPEKTSTLIEKRTSIKLKANLTCKNSSFFF